MDRKNGANFWILVHPDRNHAGVPIVAVQHFGLPNMPGKFRRGTGKEGETPILIFASVDPLGIEDRMADQIEGQTVLGMARFIDSKVRAHGVGPPDRFRRNLKLAPEPAIARHDQPHVMAQAGEGGRQGAHHVPHAANLDHRGAFGCGEQHAHGGSGGRTQLYGGPS